MHARVDPSNDTHSVPGTAAIRMLLGEGVPNTDPVWAGIGEFGWCVVWCVCLCVTMNDN